MCRVAARACYSTLKKNPTNGKLQFQRSNKDRLDTYANPFTSCFLRREQQPVHLTFIFSV